MVFASPAALRNVAATAAALTAEQRSALAGVRTVLSAGAPVPVPLLRRVQELMPGAELHTPYGMTEALPVDRHLAGRDRGRGPGNGVCVGRPVPGVQVRISRARRAGPADRPARATRRRVTGEICVAAAHVKDRYDRLWATERAELARPRLAPDRRRRAPRRRTAGCGSRADWCT